MIDEHIPSVVFVCHTPLHILISLMVAHSERLPNKPAFIIIDDSTGLGELADTIVPPAQIDTIKLPGDANADTPFNRLLTERSNAKLLKNRYAQHTETVFTFHDIRAESQALLSAKRVHNSQRRRIILLEDGVALYAPHGLIYGGPLSVVKRKLAFGLSWRYGRKIGLNTAITEIRCFYPKLVREDLRNRNVAKLTADVPASVADNVCLDHDLPDCDFAIIAVPYTSNLTDRFLSSYLLAAGRYCERHRLVPVFKLHPRDFQARARIANRVLDARYFPQRLPLEVALFSQHPPHAVIGSKTSALHICKALSPAMQCLYFEIGEDDASRIWQKFYSDVGIPPLESR